MTYHYPDHSSISDWSCNYLHQPIRSTTQIWVVTLYQYGISALVTQTSFREETSSDVNGNVGCFLRLTTTSSSNGTAREKRPISLLGARDKKGGTWHPTLTKHRSLLWGLACCRYLEVALSIIIPQMRVLVNWYGRFLYSPLRSSQKSVSLFLNSQEWLPPTAPLKINTISKSELNRNFNQNAKNTTSPVAPVSALSLARAPPFCRLYLHL